MPGFRLCTIASARYAACIASEGPNPSGASSVREWKKPMAKYHVQYKILPAGVGPDDYESADLENGETVVELPDPEPTGVAIAGEEISYLPPMPMFHRAVAAQLADGAQPIIGVGCIQRLHG